MKRQLDCNAGSVMNAYHDIDGYPCGASYELLTEILRGELVLME